MLIVIINDYIKYNGYKLHPINDQTSRFGDVYLTICWLIFTHAHMKTWELQHRSFSFVSTVATSAKEGSSAHRLLEVNKKLWN